MQDIIEIMAVNERSSCSKTKNEEDDIQLDVDVWDVSISSGNVIYHSSRAMFNLLIYNDQTKTILRHLNFKLQLKLFINKIYHRATSVL